MAEHTPGRVHISTTFGSGKYVCAIAAEGGEYVCEVVRWSDWPGNARRLAAAWNACEGISTEALESGAVADLIAACEQLVALMPEMTVRDIISRGNDVIDAAGLNPWCINEGRATGDELHDVTWKARAAIAAARGT